MSNSVRPHRWQPTRLLRPRDSLGKNTGAGCHFLLQDTIEHSTETFKIYPLSNFQVHNAVLLAVFILYCQDTLQNVPSAQNAINPSFIYCD